MKTTLLASFMLFNIFSAAHAMEGDNFGKSVRAAILGTCAVVSGGFLYNGLNTLFGSKKTISSTKYTVHESRQITKLNKHLPTHLITRHHPTRPNKKDIMQGSILCTLGIGGLFGSWWASRYI